MKNIMTVKFIVLGIATLFTSMLFTSCGSDDGTCVETTWYQDSVITG